MPEANASEDWLVGLRRHVETKPLVLIRLDEKDSGNLFDSRGGFNEFTFARSHDLLSDISTPTACLIFNAAPAWTRSAGEEPYAHFGIVSSKGPVTTLETRIKIRRGVRVTPASPGGLVALLETGAQASHLRRKLESGSPVSVLSPKLSAAVIDALASIPTNLGAVQSVAESLYAPRRFSNFAAMQEDAVQTALKAFGLGASDRAERVELVDGRPTALARIPLEEDAFEDAMPSERIAMQSVRVPLVEDSVIEHDARTVPGYTLTSSDLTGRAVFKKAGETLQVITANRRDLEHVFGVDLIYLNLTKQNIVMVQYKMLNPNRREGEPTDWLYRPDADIADQIAKMKRFAEQHVRGPREYRLSPQVFYLKFVKRDAAFSNGSIITPIDHYEQLLTDPACRGERDAVRISYDSLRGRYMRQGAFVDLIKSGYIGAYACGTDHMAALIQAVLDGDRAVVAAIQTAR